MISRWFAFLLVALAGELVVISPVAVQALSGGLECGQLVVDQQHGATATDELAHHIEMSTPDQTGLGVADTCYEYGCLSDLTFSFGIGPAVFFETRMPNAWDVTDRVDQSGPLGLRRPPKA